MMSPNDGERYDALRREVTALRRWAKAATNAFEDLMQSCSSREAGKKPAEAMHPDDWKRAQNWGVEIQHAREAAEAAGNGVGDT